MADKSHILTDQKLEEMEKRLSAIYSRAEKEIGERWKEYLAESQAEIDELQKAYDLAKEGGDQKEIRKAGRKLSKAKRDRTLMNNRFKDLTERTAAELSNVNKTALAYINGQLPEVYSINYNVLAPTVDGVGGYSFALVDADTVKNLATTDKSLLPYKELDEKKDIRWNVKKMNAEVLQGIVQGEPMDRIASRLSKVIGMDETAAIRNARTMVTGAENKGRQDSYQRAKDDGIILRKYWLATYDKRARDWHKEAGNKYNEDNAIEIDEFFVVDGEDMLYPGDSEHGAGGHNIYNCRCSIASTIKGFGKVRIRQETFVGQVGDVQVLGLRQTPSLDVGAFDEQEKKPVELNPSKIERKKITESKTIDNVYDADVRYSSETEYLEWRKANMPTLKENGIRSDVAAREEWIKKRMQAQQHSFYGVSKEDAIKTISESVPDQTMRSWFVSADSDAKPKIVEAIMRKDDAWNAGMNVAWQNYVETTGKNVSLEEFMSTPIKMYRGTRGQSEVKSDVWVSFSFDKKIAQSFGDQIEEITIRPMDTWGSYQTTAEGEILVPKMWLKGKGLRN